MSKIERALNRARSERGNFPVPAPTEIGRSTKGTALVPEHSEEASVQAITSMNASESEFFTAGDLAQRGIIHPERVDDRTVQVFRELRTKIIQQSHGRNGVILITSINPGDGSSFIAQNLAAAFAFDAGKTALLVDCNIRNPSIAEQMADASAPGLTDYLFDPDLGVEQIIQPVGIARLRAIAAGGRRATGAEYFTSQKMRQLIESLRVRYKERFIVLDGPPMSDVANIRILSELCDYVMVVARHGRATVSQIENGLSVINDKKLLGVIFNDEPRIPWGK